MTEIVNTIIKSIKPDDYAFSQHFGECFYDSLYFPILHGKLINTYLKNDLKDVLINTIAGRETYLEVDFRGVIILRSLYTILKKYENDALFNNLINALNIYVKIGSKSIKDFFTSPTCVQPDTGAKLRREASYLGATKTREIIPRSICTSVNYSKTTTEEETRKYLACYLDTFLKQISPSGLLCSSIVSNFKSFIDGEGFAFQFVTPAKKVPIGQFQHSIGHAVSITRTDNNKFYLFDNQMTARHLIGGLHVSEYVNILREPVNSDYPVFMHINYNDPPGSNIYLCPKLIQWDGCERPKQWPLFHSYIVFFWMDREKKVKLIILQISHSGIERIMLNTPVGNMFEYYYFNLMSYIYSKLGDSLSNYYKFNSKSVLTTENGIEDKLVLFPDDFYKDIQNEFPNFNIEYLFYCNRNTMFRIDSLVGGKK